MPIALQESSTFSILGHCTVENSNQDNKSMCQQTSVPSMNCMQAEQKEENASEECDTVTTGRKEVSSCDTLYSKYSGSFHCACTKINQALEHPRKVVIRLENWIQIVTKSQGIMPRESNWIPKVHHIHQNGHILSVCDVHMILYDPPVYGRHHFHLSYWGSCEQTVASFRKPIWFHKLQQSPLPSNLEKAVMALNCSSAAIVYFDRHLATEGSESCFNFISRLTSVLWFMLAASVAVASSLTYTALQFFHRFMAFQPCTFVFVVLRKLFAQTCNSMHLRSCQFLYWPIFLLESGFRAQSNVEYAHRTALRKHFMWSSIAMDVMLGTVFGVALLINAEAVYSGIFLSAHYVTDNLLRSGCVWLMGVPAGFKLNTELAQLLGMVSLTAIQIFSTLGFFVASIFWHIIKGLAVSGILFGFTISASLCIDMLKLATLHVRILHCLMSFLYSRQIQALASLWRLFRGRKWNPLRIRLDSYEYCVEQHVVGSLLFTPLLLLLPTTSVFYMFFTILNATISFICLIIEITISILHATPYCELLLWLISRRRFPSGVWIEIMSCQFSLSSNIHGLDRKFTSDAINREPDTVVSLLNSNCAKLGYLCIGSYLQHKSPERYLLL